jgi:hypothetical protein
VGCQQWTLELVVTLAIERDEHRSPLIEMLTNVLGQSLCRVRLVWSVDSPIYVSEP